MKDLQRYELALGGQGWELGKDDQGSFVKADEAEARIAALELDSRRLAVLERWRESRVLYISAPFNLVLTKPVVEIADWLLEREAAEQGGE